MKKFGFLIAAILLVGTLGGVLASEEYKEVQENEYWVSWDGSANVTLKTVLYSPEDLVNKTREGILKMGLENATKMFLLQKQQALSQIGITLENTSVEFPGYDTTGPFVGVIHGKITGLARYYSYDDTWEILLDVLRMLDLSGIDPTTINSSMHLENYFTVHLPPGAKVENITKGFKAESNGSYIQLDVNVTGDVIEAHSIIYFKDGITKDDFEALYSELRPLIIKYTGKTGIENYTTWDMRIYNNITIEGDKTFLSTVEEYVKPEDYVNYLKLQFVYQGIQQVEQSLYNGYAQQFQNSGIKVLSGNVSVTNVESDGPLIVKYQWALQGLVSKVNNTYIYSYNPKLEFGDMNFSRRLNAAINETKVTRIKLPEGYEFIELPQSIDTKTDAGSVVMKVTKLNDREILIESNVYLRYGIPAEAYQELMSQVPSNVEFKYTSSGEGNSICGPGIVIGLAIVLGIAFKKR